MITKLLRAVCVLQLALLPLLLTPVASAQSRDCDDNAIVRCGAATVSELNSKLTSEITSIFSHYGIATSELSDTVEGVVRKDGTVLVNNQVVATNAITAGRQPMPGSTFLSGLNIYERPPSVSFNSDELTAFVKMTNGKFDFAILHSCGNPVRATPIPPKHPAISIVKTVSKSEVILGEAFDYTITVKNTGDVNLVKLVITDSAPSGITFLNPSNPSLAFNQTFSTTTDLSVGASKSYAIRAQASSEIANKIINTACVDVAEISGTRDHCARAEVQMVCAVNRNVTINSPECRIKPVVQPVSQPLPPKPEVKAAVVSAPVILPATGPADVLGLAGSTSIASYAGSLFYRRLRKYIR